MSIPLKLGCFCCFALALYGVLLAQAQETTFRETCRMRRIVHTIRVEDCRPKRLLSWACQGECRSYMQIGGPKAQQIQRLCNCCQDMGSRQHNVTITCYNPEGPRRMKRVVMGISLPTGCMCRPCSGGEEVEPQEMASLPEKRAQSLDMLMYV